MACSILNHVVRLACSLVCLADLAFSQLPPERKDVVDLSISTIRILSWNLEADARLDPIVAESVEASFDSSFGNELMLFDFLCLQGLSPDSAREGPLSTSLMKLPRNTTISESGDQSRLSTTSMRNISMGTRRYSRVSEEPISHTSCNALR